ncbi:hypothetical protein PVK06_000511 [Gossypium arboreum]|uniref:Uncharacterized protein n=1 Tax=Gossypium arboreum TaxID=29729 RepID=A0ABR0QYJ6_GOSAR|nr:hypothetical protein PVK06_000511 [Gossypium arboreum]
MENFWWICSNRCRIGSIKSKLAASFWRPPPHGCLKFNVCGIANEDKKGCRGVLRDKEGIVRDIGKVGNVVFSMAKKNGIEMASS